METVPRQITFRLAPNHVMSRALWSGFFLLVTIVLNGASWRNQRDYFIATEVNEEFRLNDKLWKAIDKYKQKHLFKLSAIENKKINVAIVGIVRSSTARIKFKNCQNWYSKDYLMFKLVTKTYVNLPKGRNKLFQWIWQPIVKKLQVISPHDNNFLVVSHSVRHIRLYFR